MGGSGDGDGRGLNFRVTMYPVLGCVQVRLELRPYSIPSFTVPGV